MSTTDRSIYTGKIAVAGAIRNWVERVNKIDDHTVEFVLTRPDSRFHTYATEFPTSVAWGGAYVLPKHIYEGKDPLEVSNYPPVGTGSYTLLKAGPTFVLYERDDDWWATEVFGVRPAPKHVIFQSVGPEDELAHKLAANELEAVMFGSISYGAYETVHRQNPEVNVWRAVPPYGWVDPCPRIIAFNNLICPWSLPEVRTAISYMINRTQVAELDYEYTTEPAPYPFPPYGAMADYMDALDDLIAEYEPDVHDPDRAAAILTDAGFTKGADGVWVSPNGTRLAMEFISWAEQKS